MATQKLYPFSLFEDVTSKTPAFFELVTRDVLIECLTEVSPVKSKTEAYLFLSADFIDPKKECRKLQGIRGVHLVVGDIDGKFNPDSFQSGLDKLRANNIPFVAYQTFNSKPDMQRWRIVTLLDYPVQVHQYAQCWEGLNTAFSKTLDANAKDASRLSYLPSRPEGEERQVIVFEGRI